jgi:DNA/RNA-binding protein KIN17
MDCRHEDRSNLDHLIRAYDKSGETAESPTIDPSPLSTPPLRLDNKPYSTMARAERGTPKAIANQQKSKGLQRLRWYCQVCEKQCRDENGFKCHVQSEAHVRQMSIVSENPHCHIANYSRQFMGDFLQLLRTTHGEKRVQANSFYASQYIRDKNRIHMNATRWRNLTEFVTFLGISGICRVEDTEKGWFISWIDTSPEAMKKRDANVKRERMEKGEDREDRLIKEQVERARLEAIEKALDDTEGSMNSESITSRSLEAEWHR